MTGYVKLHRAVFDHECFGNEEFSRREAWLWLVAKAAWMPHGYRYKEAMIPIMRGQLPGARKHLADAWGWGQQRVRTFLERLTIEGMITTDSNQQLTIITICNYDRYQAAEETSNQQLTSSQPASNHTKEIKKLKSTETREREFEKIHPEIEFDGDTFVHENFKLSIRAVDCMLFGVSELDKPKLEKFLEGIALSWVTDGSRPGNPALLAKSAWLADRNRDAIQDVRSKRAATPYRQRSHPVDDVATLSEMKKTPLPTGLKPVLDGVFSDG